MEAGLFLFSQSAKTSFSGRDNQLEIKYAEQQQHADAVGDDDDDIVLEQTVNYPQADPRGEQSKHFERQVIRLAGIPAFLQLGEIGYGREKCRDGSCHCGEHVFTPVTSATIADALRAKA